MQPEIKLLFHVQAYKESMFFRVPAWKLDKTDRLHR
jgi:hypothetical protein